MKPVRLLFPLLLLFAGCIRQNDSAKINVGDTIPAFSVCSEGACFKCPEDIRKRNAVIVFIDPTCEDCRNYVSVLNECDDIIVISRNENEEKIRIFLAETGLEHELFYKGGYDVYHSMFDSVVPRVIFVKNAVVHTLFAEPDIPDARSISDFISQ